MLYCKHGKHKTCRAANIILAERGITKHATNFFLFLIRRSSSLSRCDRQLRAPSDWSKRTWWCVDIFIPTSDLCEGISTAWLSFPSPSCRVPIIDEKPDLIEWLKHATVRWRCRCFVFWGSIRHIKQEKRMFSSKRQDQPHEREHEHVHEHEHLWTCTWTTRWTKPWLRWEERPIHNCTTRMGMIFRRFCS